MKTPELETERLLLRTFRETDVEAVFYGWENDAEVAKYMFWASHNDIEKTKQWINSEMGKIDKDDWYRWALVKKDTMELIGTGLIYYEADIPSRRFFHLIITGYLFSLLNLRGRDSVPFFLHIKLRRLLFPWSIHLV